MQPTQNQIHVNVPLTMMSVAYIQEATQFIANQAAPLIPSDYKSNLYYVYDKDDWFRDEAEVRAPGTESAGSGHTLHTDSFLCRPYSFHDDIADMDRSNADPVLDLEADSTAIVTQKMLIKREKVWASKFWKAGVWGTDQTGVAAGPGANQFIRWDDYNNSDPRAQVKAGVRKILSTTGFKPNTLILGYDVKDALIDHPTFVDRVKYTSRESVTPEMIASFFDVGRVLVPMSTEERAVKGAASDMDFIFSAKHALLAYVAPKPGKRVPSAMYTFTWRYAPIAPNEGVRIKKFRMENIESDRVEGTISFDDKLVAADMGYFFANAVN